MNILLLSDSHGHPDCIREAIRVAEPDCVLFAGDGLRDMAEVLGSLRVPVHAVRGNCDMMFRDPGYACYPEEALITLEGTRILLAHGHTLGVKGGLARAILRANSLQADVMVFGHTHEVFEMSLRPDADDPAARNPHPLLMCNPGSVGRYPHSFGTLTLRGGQALFGSGRL